MEDFEVIYGIHPVEEILNSPKKIAKILIKKSDKLNQKILKLIVLAEVNNVKIKQVKEEEITKIVPEGVHQGIAAYVKKQKKISRIDYSKNLYVIPDHITDVHNMGAVLRSTEFFKSDGILLPKKRSADINPTVKKTSAGAVSYLNMIFVSNIGNEIDNFKKNNFWIIGADVEGEDNLYDFKFPSKSVIIIGNEEKGISHLVREKLDFKVKIPGFGQIQSLNVSVACALFLFQYRKYHVIG